MTLFAGFMARVLYSKSFLSTLVAKDFEQTIDTIQDVLASNLTMYYPGKTAIAKYLNFNHLSLLAPRHYLAKYFFKNAKISN